MVKAILRFMPSFLLEYDMQLSTLMQELSLLRHDSAFDYTLKKMGIWSIWEDIQRNNPSGNNPYHNNPHMKYMARVAYELYCLTNLIGGHFIPDEAITIVLAGLVHDADHSGGVYTDDSDNIAQARTFLAGLRLRHPYIADHIWNDVDTLVQSTRFPHTSTHGFHHLEGYVRDADFMYSLEIYSLNPIMHGIPEELVHKLGKLLTPSQFVDPQQAFMNHAVFHTHAGSHIWAQCKDKAFELEQNYALGTLQSVKTLP